MRTCQGKAFLGPKTAANFSPALQTRAPWTEVKVAQMTQSCLAGVHNVLSAEGPRVFQKSLAPGQTRLASVQQAVCSYARKDLYAFMPSPKHFGPDLI